MRSKSIERHLSEAADDAESIVHLERNANRAAVEDWHGSSAFAALQGKVELLSRAMARARGNLDREAGAARHLAGFLAQYYGALVDYFTAWSPRRI